PLPVPLRRTRRAGAARGGGVRRVTAPAHASAPDVLPDGDGRDARLRRARHGLGPRGRAGGGGVRRGGRAHGRGLGPRPPRRRHGLGRSGPRQLQRRLRRGGRTVGARRGLRGRPALFSAPSPSSLVLRPVALSYTLREGLAGFSRAKFSAAMAMTALAVELVLIGLVGLLAWEGQRTADLVQQAVGTVEVFLEPVDGDDVARLRARLVALPGVDSVRFVSQQEAAAIFRRDFGDEAAQFDSELFLPASFRVRLGPRYAVSDSLAAFKRRVDTWIKVDEVVYNADLVESIEGNIRRWSLAGLGIGLLVVLAALLLV